jgi:hypothetical protein
MVPFSLIHSHALQHPVSAVESKNVREVGPLVTSIHLVSAAAPIVDQVPADRQHCWLRDRAAAEARGPLLAAAGQAHHLVNRPDILGIARHDRASVLRNWVVPEVGV